MNAPTQPISVADLAKMVNKSESFIQDRLEFRAPPPRFSLTPEQAVAEIRRIMDAPAVSGAEWTLIGAVNEVLEQVE